MDENGITILFDIVPGLAAAAGWVLGIATA